MAVYAVGDVQGCLDELQDLLSVLKFRKKRDTLWLVGDLVNRGPKSLETLRFVRDLGDAAITVLGNHDLHLLGLALASGKRAPEADLKKVLKAKDRDELIDWLRHRPLLHHDPDLNTTMVHAGIYPRWSLNKARKRAAEVEAALRGPDVARFLRNMYGNKPDTWSGGLSGYSRLRFIVNSFTRMRFCHEDSSLDFSAKLHPEDHRDLHAWFDVPGRRADDTRIVFGHWSTLGYMEEHNLLSLDTGCVWGGRLTAVRLDAFEPLNQIKSRQPRKF